MRNLVFWLFIGIVSFLIFIPILKFENTSIILAYTFTLFLSIGLFFKQKQNYNKYLILMPINLIISFGAIFLNPLLIPLIFPFVNIFSILGFWIGTNLSFKIKNVAFLSIFILIPFFVFTHFKYIPEQAFLKRQISDLKIENIDKVRLYNLNDEKIDSFLITNKLLVLNFTSTNCSQCIIKKPYLESIKNQFKYNDNILFYDVFVASYDSIRSVKQFLKKRPSELNIAYDKYNEMSNLIGLNGVPHEIIISQNGKILRNMAGFNSDLKDIYVKQTHKLLEEILNK